MEKMAKMIKKPSIICLALFLLPVFHGPLFAQEPRKNSLTEQMTRDDAVIRHSRQGLARTIAFIKTYPDLLPPIQDEKGDFLGAQQRVAFRQAWQGFLDYMLVLDRLAKRCDALPKDLGVSEKNLFYVQYAIFLAQYRFSLAFIQAVEKRPGAHVVLDEPVPEMGLRKGAYSALKEEFLNLSKGADFALMEANYSLYGKSSPTPLTEGIEEDREFIWRAGKAPELTAQNALQSIKDFGFKAWLPIQIRVAEWMGDTKVWRPDQSLITPAQIKAMRKLLKPGDVLLARREWYLSNMGIPGYWTHALLYVGTPEARRLYFAGDGQLEKWSQWQGIHNGDVEQLIRFFARDAYKENRNGNDDGIQVPVIESKSEGVCLSTLEHAASADALVVLRPRLPKVSKAKAIFKAFSYVGRPYDFDFDFQTDAEMVCTEVVYKAYEPGPLVPGLHLPLTDLLGRKLMTANDVAMVFDQEYGSQKQQFDFVLFLDGDEKERMAYLSNVEGFRKSWKRPKWHILAPQK